jgi:hypothetical protein
MRDYEYDSDFVPYAYGRDEEDDDDKYKGCNLRESIRRNRCRREEKRRVEKIRVVRELLMRADMPSDLVEIIMESLTVNIYDSSSS